MSYSSESTLPRSAGLASVQELIALLGYKREPAMLRRYLPTLVGTYTWFEDKDYKSWSGKRAATNQGAAESLSIHWGG
jgi:hypothetical protein